MHRVDIGSCKLSQFEESPVSHIGYMAAEHSV